MRRWRRRGATVADLLHCGADEVSFGANMSTITFHLGRALARQWGPGDEIVITELDHHANQDTWRAAAADRGLTVRAVKFDQARLELDWDDFARQITPQTKLVAIGAASNAVGTINDVARAVALAKSVGALTFVDAVHFVPHASTDVQALGCDFLACSAYKFYGPHLGILYGRRELVDALDAPKLQPAPDYSPERLETGTQNHEGIVAAAAAVDFLAGIGGFAAGGAPGDRRAALERAFAALHGRGDALLARLWNGLGGIDGVRLYGRLPGAAADADGGLHRRRPRRRRRRRAPGGARRLRVARRFLRVDGGGPAEARARAAWSAPAAPATRPRARSIG